MRQEVCSESRKMIFWGCVISLVLFVGCGQKVQEKIVEKMIENEAAKHGDKVDVNLSQGTMTVKTEDSTATFNMESGTGTVKTQSGEMVYSSGEKVDLSNFPKDVPQYPGWKPNMVMRDSSEKVITVAASSSDSPDKIREFFKENMEKHGWTEESSLTQDMGKMYLFTFSKADREATLMIVKGDQGSEITLTAHE